MQERIRTVNRGLKGWKGEAKKFNCPINGCLFSLDDDESGFHPFMILGSSSNALFSPCLPVQVTKMELDGCFGSPYVVEALEYDPS